EPPLLDTEVPLVEALIILVLPLVQEVTEQHVPARLDHQHHLTNSLQRVVTVVKGVPGIGKVEMPGWQHLGEALRVGLARSGQRGQTGFGEQPVVPISLRVDGGDLHHPALPYLAKTRQGTCPNIEDANGRAWWRVEDLSDQRLQRAGRVGVELKCFRPG